MPLFKLDWIDCGDDVALFLKTIETFNQGLEQFPESTDLHNNLALTYYKVQNFDSAITHFKQCLKLKIILGITENNKRLLGRTSVTLGKVMFKQVKIIS